MQLVTINIGFDKHLEFLTWEGSSQIAWLEYLIERGFGQCLDWSEGLKTYC